MSAPTMPHFRREQLCSERVKLHGKDAVIVGINSRFAKVVQFDTGNSVEYAWPVVDHIVKTYNGEFD